jgi:hypothetical protein
MDNLYVVLICAYSLKKLTQYRGTHPDCSDWRRGSGSIEFVDQLPKTISGKIKRNELRDREMKQFQNAGNGRAKS